MVAQQLIALVDQVIAQQDSERFVAHMLAGAEDGMAQALRIPLPDIVERAQAGGVLDCSKWSRSPLSSERIAPGKVPGRSGPPVRVSGVL